MTALEVLEKSEIFSLPVDINRIADAFGIKIFSYKEITRQYDITMKELYFLSALGFSFSDGGQPVCAVNENACGNMRRRWTMAHEISHCLLGHVKPSPQPLSQREEREADAFAAQLLAPLVVVHYCAVSSPRELATLCRISDKAAGYRYRELTELRESCAECCRSCAPYGGALADSSALCTLSRFAPFIAEYLCERPCRFSD